MNKDLLPSIKVLVATLAATIMTLVEQAARDQGIEPRDFIVALVVAIVGYFVPELNPSRSALEAAGTGQTVTPVTPDE